MICKVPGCGKKLSPRDARGMCSKHYRLSRTKIRKCPQCGEVKKIVGNSKVCGACSWWNRSHKEAKVAPLRIRDGFKTKEHPIKYRIYRGMKGRCENVKNKKYANWGGRGIKVCDRWKGPYGFYNFYQDMGDRPGPQYSIDRIDVNGDYCPENCRWATCNVQAANRRMQRKYSAQVGVTYNIALGLWSANLQVNKNKYQAWCKTEQAAIEKRIEFERLYL